MIEIFLSCPRLPIWPYDPKLKIHVGNWAEGLFVISNLCFLLLLTDFSLSFFLFFAFEAVNLLSYFVIWILEKFRSTYDFLLKLFVIFCLSDFLFISDNCTKNSHYTWRISEVFFVALITTSVNLTKEFSPQKKLKSLFCNNKKSWNLLFVPMDFKINAKSIKWSILNHV